jgi:hypothetical protein
MTQEVELVHCKKTDKRDSLAVLGVDSKQLLDICRHSPRLGHKILHKIESKGMRLQDMK